MILSKKIMCDELISFHDKITDFIKVSVVDLIHLDLSKALGTVLHRDLLAKLEKMGIDVIIVT